MCVCFFILIFYNIYSIFIDIRRAQRRVHAQVEASQGRRRRAHRVLPGGQAGHRHRRVGALRQVG